MLNYNQFDFFFFAFSHSNMQIERKYLIYDKVLSLWSTSKIILQFTM